MLKPFFTYYGGKYRIALKYPKPEYGTIIEPFAGSAGYSLRYPDRQILLNDLDPTIAGLWRYLIGVSESEIRNLPLDISHTDELQSLPTEARALIGFWLNKGCSSPCKQPSAWMREGLRPNSFWGETIRERVASQLQYIRHWKVNQKSYGDLRDVPGTWFIDPPYQAPAGRHYKFDGVDFSALGSWCKSRPGQVIVCESEGADWLPFEPFVVAKANESKTGGKKSKEVIYLTSNAPLSLGA